MERESIALLLTSTPKRVVNSRQHRSTWKRLGIQMKRCQRFVMYCFLMMDFPQYSAMVYLTTTSMQHLIYAMYHLPTLLPDPCSAWSMLLPTLLPHPCSAWSILSLTLLPHASCAWSMLSPTYLYLTTHTSMQCLIWAITYLPYCHSHALSYYHIHVASDLRHHLHMYFPTSCLLASSINRCHYWYICKCQEHQWFQQWYLAMSLTLHAQFYVAIWFRFEDCRVYGMLTQFSVGETKSLAPLQKAISLL